MNIKINNKLLITGLAIIILTPVITFAQDYVPLAPLDGLISAAESRNIGTYLNGLFKAGIIIASILGVLMITVGGVQYMTTDAVYGKEEGKQRIQAALAGIILALASWIILATINTNLTSGTIGLEQAGIGDGSLGDVLYEDVPHTFETQYSGPITHNHDYSGTAESGQFYTSAENWPSKYLSPEEMRSNGDGTIKASGKLLNSFDKMRESYGAPIGVVSGYRDHNHNHSVGGASNSQHTHGTAVDLSISGLSTAQRAKLLQSAIDAGFTGIGLGNTKMHVDVRPNQATWGYIGGSSSGGGDTPAWAKPILSANGYETN